MGGLLAGGAAAAAAAYGAHQLAGHHGQGSHQVSHGGYYPSHGMPGFGGHGKVKHGKFGKHGGKHGKFGKHGHGGGKFKKWK